MLTEINGNIDATYPIITGELTGYLGPIGTVTASADNSVGTPHVIVTQTPTPDGLDIDFAFKEMGIPGLDLTVEQDLTEEQQQTARENIDAQETLTFDNVPTSGSSNPVTSAGIYAADEDLKDYVDDSINRSSAFFRGNFATYAALMAVPWQTTDPDAPNFVSNNDYAAVADDETHSHESWRYIYVLEEGGQDNGWTAQYRINESPFTVEQLAAINSGITANDVTKLAGIEQGAQVNTVTGVKGDAEANYRTGNINITKANIGLGNVDNTSDADKPVSTAQQAAIEAATKALYDVKSAGPAAIVSIHDAEAIPVKSLIAQITPVQDLHGQSAPYPAGGGKNLLDEIPTTTNLGITFSMASDGAYVINGTATANAWVDLFNGTLPAGDYVINGYTGASSTSFRTRLLINGEAIGYNDTSKRTFTLTESSTVIIALFAYPAYGAFNNVKVYYQLETGTTPTTWTPVSNICPISGWTGAKINKAGKNLFDINSDFIKTVDARYSVSGDSITITTVSSSSQNIRTLITKVSPDMVGKSIALSGTISGSSPQTNAFRLRVYDSASLNGSFVDFSTSAGASVGVVTQEMVGKYLAIVLYAPTTSGQSTTYTKVQVEFGSTATEYEAYQGQQIAISWTDEAGTVYGGTLTYIGNGKYSLQPMVKGVDMGTSTDITYTNNPTLAAQGIFPFELAGSNYENGIICSTYPVRYATNWTVNDKEIVARTSSQGCRIRNTDYTTLASLKTHLTGTLIVYPLATLPAPIILDAEDVKTLLGDNNIFVDTGDVQVTYETGTVAVALADLYEKLAAQIGA